MTEELRDYLVNTPNHANARLELLKQIIPDLFDGEGNLIPNELRGLIEESASTGNERYEFKWTGKARSKKGAFAPTSATLNLNEEKSFGNLESPHVVVEGDNLEVLKLLSSSYQRRIKCIYIDPPYNTGNDFVYNDDYSEDRKAYWERSGVAEDGVRIDSNTESSGRYHSNWLTMMNSRLLLARKLLKSDGAIFVSIDDHEIHNLRRLMDEIFGPENYRNTFIVRRYDKNVNRQFIEKGLVSFNTGFEYIICYSKSDEFKFNPVYKAASEERKNFGYWKGFWNDADRETMRYEIHGFTPESGQWKWGETRGLKAVKNYEEYVKKHSQNKSIEEYWEETGKELEFIKRNPDGKGKNKGVEHWIPPSDGILRNTNWLDFFASKSTEEVGDIFDFPKNPDVIKNLIRCCESNGDIILDFFAGSGSTAQAVLELNAEDQKTRKVILVQLPEAIDENSESGKRALAKGMKTITDITIHRVTNVIKNNEDSLRIEDQGFKVFTLAKSNFPRVNFQHDSSKTTDENVAALKKYISEKESAMYSLFNERSILDEVILKSGFTLNHQVQHVSDCESNTIHYVIDEYKKAFICVDSKIEDATINWVKQNVKERFICLDRALDTAKKLNLTNVLDYNLRTF